MSFAEAVLRLFCYSSRPKWDSFGYLVSCGQRQGHGPLSLSDRFGADIWNKLEGRTVLDYGCGYGADVLECCKRGIDAIGIERRQFMVEAAQQKATEAGIGKRFYNNDDCDHLAGRFDYVLSVDAFEHYLDAAAVLESMRRLLKSSAGIVLVYFSPPWLHPYGAHCREMTAFPWVQFFFPERAVMALRAEYFSEKPTCYEEAGGGLSRMTIAKFRSVVARSAFVLCDLELVGIRKIKVVTRIPGIRELFTSSIRAELALKP